VTAWEKRIIDAFVERYPGSAAAVVSGSEGSAKTAGSPGDATAGPAGCESADDGDTPGREPRPLRLRLDRIFPDFERAAPDDRESFLEAAETLEQRGLLSLVWVRHRKGEIPAALVCRKADLLFELAGKPSPRIVAEDVRRVARALAVAAEGHQAAGTITHETGETEIALFLFIAENFTPQDAALGIDVMAVTDLARLTGFFSGVEEPKIQRPDKIQGLTPRALSVALYGDSKRLETLISLLSPLLNRARKMGAAVPHFAFLDRSYPETLIAGKIILHFKGTSDSGTAGIGERELPCLPENAAAPLVNATGSILAFPLGTILKLQSIAPLEGKTASVLMIENKETFFVLAESLPGYTCFLYTGGHPNRAVQALVSLLAKSGFTFSHAGDLDPDGILILQELGEITGKRIRPVRMDAATFDRYLNCGRKLEPTMLRRIGLISHETRSLPGMEELIRRIEETARGVEQEIIDYR
jgi:hypothetical protein